MINEKKIIKNIENRIYTYMIEAKEQAKRKE